MARLIIRQSLLKARAKDDRDAPERRSKEDRDVARAESAKNAAEHAELDTATHDLKTQVGALLDRSSRPGPGNPED